MKGFAVMKNRKKFWIGKQKVTDAFKILDLVIHLVFLQHFGSKQKVAMVLLVG